MRYYHIDGRKRKSLSKTCKISELRKRRRGSSRFQRPANVLERMDMVMWPDTANAQLYLGRFCKNPGPTHIAAVDRALLYGYQTRYLAIEYSAPENLTDETCLIWNASSDASFADDIETRKSTEGMLIILFGGAIDWRARRHLSCDSLQSKRRALCVM